MGLGYSSGGRGLSWHTQSPRLWCHMAYRRWRQKDRELKVGSRPVSEKWDHVSNKKFRTYAESNICKLCQLLMDSLGTDTYYPENKHFRAAINKNYTKRDGCFPGDISVFKYAQVARADETQRDIRNSHLTTANKRQKCSSKCPHTGQGTKASELIRHNAKDKQDRECIRSVLVPLPFLNHVMTSCLNRFA